tara:strand:+ start:180 stop:797 length:618 start_codon:yes stop_codon:yes gene_type:complete
MTEVIHNRLKRQSVAIHKFVKRQTPSSGYSYRAGLGWDCDWYDVLDDIMSNFDKAYTGSISGVLYVPLDPEKYRTAVRVLKDKDQLYGQFRTREGQEGKEEPRKSFRTTTMGGHDAKVAYAVLYSSVKLAESGQETMLEPVEGHWELISINASPVEGEMPIDPETLMHNHFGSSGGSATGMSDEEFLKQLRESFDWWKDKAMCAN